MTKECKRVIDYRTFRMVVAVSLFCLFCAHSSEASAAPASAFAASGSIACQSVSPANEIPQPPPLWQGIGAKPSAADEALINNANRPCPSGEVAVPISTGQGVADLTPIGSNPIQTTQSNNGLSLPNELAGGEAPGSGLACHSEKHGCYWYAKSETMKSAIGMEYQTNISQPVVSLFPGAHSIDQLAVAHEGTLYTMELGINVDRTVNPSAPEKPHLFIYINKDNYASNGEPGGDCYNCDFVPAVEAILAPGEVLEPSTSKITLGVKYYQGNWWVYAGTQWIGYVPGSFWGGKFTEAERESIYGEVYDDEFEPTSQMGNGEYGKSPTATSVANPVVLTNETTKVAVKFENGLDNEPAYYSAGDYNSGYTEWHIGGPGSRRSAFPPWAFRQSSGALDVFFRGADGALWQQEWTSSAGWEQPYRIGGYMTSAPMGYVEPNGTMNIFYRGGNDAIWQYYRNTSGAWSTQELGGSAAGRPYGYIQSNEDQNIFYRGTNNEIWQLFYEPSTGWHNIALGGNSAAGDPVAYLEPNGNQNVFYVTNEGTIGQLWWRSSDGWHNSPLGGSAVGTPTGYYQNGHQNVFFRTAEGSMGQWWWTESSGWHNSPLGGGAGSVTGNPFAFASPGGQQHVYYRNYYGTIGEWLYGESSGWSEKELGEGASSDPVGFSQPNGDLNVYFFEAGTESLDQWLYNGSGWSISTICSRCG